MPYITVNVHQHEHQISFEEIIFGEYRLPPARSDCQSNTRTVYVDRIQEELLRKVNVRNMIVMLEKFSESHKELYCVERSKLYETFYIPKSSGGLRRIDAPVETLKEALRELKTLLETKIAPPEYAMHHTSAFAYVKGRCTVDAVKKHQFNESWWFLKIDFSNFFGNTTPDFLMRMFSMIFPFCEITKSTRGKRALAKALDLCFLNGGLPQGTPISPMLTNLMMIPIDHRLANCLRDFKGQRYIYTRYADDILVSSRCTFDQTQIIDFVRRTLAEFRAPFTLKDEKTRYGSRNGSNWNLGVMLNKENKITIGSKNKSRFRAMISNYINDRKRGVPWELHDVQVLRGLYEYYRSIEKQYIDGVIRFNNEKYDVDVMKMMKADLSA